MEKIILLLLHFLLFKKLQCCTLTMLRNPFKKTFSLGRGKKHVSCERSYTLFIDHVLEVAGKTSIQQPLLKLKNITQNQ